MSRTHRNLATCCFPVTATTDFQKADILKGRCRDPDDRLRGSAAGISFCDSELVSTPGKGHLGRRATGLRMVRRISQAVQVADRSLKRTEPVRQKRDGPRLLFDAGPKPRGSFSCCGYAHLVHRTAATDHRRSVNVGAGFRRLGTQPPPKVCRA